MKVAYVTEYNDWLKNRMFIETSSCNVNNVLDRYIALKGFLAGQGVHLNTFDMYGSIGEVDIWLMQEPTPGILEFILKNSIDPSRVIYFLHEPPVYNYWGWDYIRKSHYLYEAVLTWETTSTKANGKFFHYHFPVKFDPGKHEHYLKKEKKNLCLIMHSNKTSRVPGELYSFRRNVITYFEKRGDGLLDLYGHGWNNDNAPSPFFTNLYKGTTPDKRETYAEYYFSICIDNCISPGYITYDPLISMITGTVPVYTPMPDSREYIPEDTFIDMSRFKTLDELTDHLLSIRGTGAYEQIRKNGWEFVTSERYRPFTVEKFSQDVFAAIRYVRDRLSSKKNGKITMVPPERAQGYLNPHFAGLLPMQNGIRYEEAGPAKFFNSKRFDLTAKYIYVKHREMGIESDWARRLYSQHIKAFNGYREPDGSGKEGEKAFIDSFDAMIDSVRTKGFDENMSMVPVTHGGDLIEGSHRVAACMYHGVPVKTLGFSFDTWAYPYGFFLERGLPKNLCDAIACEHCKLKENTYLALLFPSAVGRDEEVRAILQRYGSIFYEKEVHLFNNGPLLLMTQIYKNENWLGDISNNFGGARLKARECFRSTSPLRVFLIETDDPQRLKDAKEEIRAIYRISNHSVHINDTHEETVRVSQLLFNENGIHFLNHAAPGAFPQFQRHYRTLQQLCAGKDRDEMEQLCITGSAVMALYGIRDARDIDYFHFGSALPDDPSGGLGSHNKEIRHYTMARDDIIFNPENHFYFDGFKFASLEVIRAMKEKRGEEKDRADIDMIRNFSNMQQEGTPMHQGPVPGRQQAAPVVSIIILNYNGFEDLRLCIDSISRNTPEPFEIIVFDNASTDNSLPYLRTLPGVLLVESQVNLGCPAGRAEAMTYIHPESRYIIFLDNDTIVTKGWTTKFIAHAGRDSSIGMMGPRSNYVSGAQLVRDASYSSIEELESFAAKWSGQAGESLSPTLRLVGFCMFITRDVVEKIGSIDASFGKFGFEDDDYTWRTLVAGFKTMIANDVFIHHKGGPQGQGNTTYNKALFDAWGTFKDKWGIPGETAYGQPFDISAILTRPFSTARDRIPLVLKRNEDTNLNDAFARAQQAVEEGRVDDAITIFDELLVRDPGSGVVHAALGTLLIGKKEYEKARDSLVKALKAMPSETGLCLQLADVCLQLNEHGNARRILEAVLGREPLNVNAMARLVDTLVASGQAPEAVEKVKNALVEDPKNPDLIAIFGHLAAVIGNLEALGTCIEKLREADPSHPGVEKLSGSLERLRSGTPSGNAAAGAAPGAGTLIPLAFIKLRDYSLDPRFLGTIRDAFHTDVFIETGTFMGSTALCASGLFREVHTVELSRDLFEKAGPRLKEAGNIRAYHGDSAGFLPGIIEKADGKILFWLDGHYSGEGTARAGKDTPIIEEINAIARSGRKDPVIMIDDIRLFPEPAMTAGQITGDYPSLGEVCRLIKTIDDGYRSIVFGDVLIAYNGPEHIFSPIVEACTVSRLYDGGNFDETTLFKAEDTIRSAVGDELAAIKACYSVFLSDSPSSGHYRLWLALVHMGSGAYADAAKEILGAIENGFYHWRLSFYLAEAYFKTGQADMARSYAEKAFKEAPLSVYARRLKEIVAENTCSGPAADQPSPQFLKDMEEYGRLLEKTEKRFPVNLEELWPLDERTPSLSFDPHYVLHTSWAARTLAATRPEKHVDISSSVYFSSIVSSFIPVDFYDYRPAPLALSGLKSEAADATRLPFPDESIESLSCMHVVEHIGLGRYGDPVDPDGDLRAVSELKRVVRPGGQLLFVVPIGRPRLVFNAHRIYSYDQIVKYFDGFSIEDFSLVPDTMLDGRWTLAAGDRELADRQSYGCGCFRLVKKLRESRPEDGEPRGNAAKGRDRTAVKDTASIIISDGGNPAALEECLLSIEKFTPERHQLIFAGSRQMCRAMEQLRKKLKGRDGYMIMEALEQEGPAQAVNRAIEKSAGEYIVIVRSDMVLTEGWLSGMISCLEQTPNAGIIGPAINGPGIRQGTAYRAFPTRAKLFEHAVSFGERNRHRRAQVKNVSGLCMLFERNLIEKIGLPDGSLDLSSFWDLDLCLRTVIAGYTIMIAADVYVHHEGPGIRKDNRQFTAKWGGMEVSTEKGRKLSAFSALEKARALSEKNRLEEAVETLIQGLKTAPEDKNIYLLLAGMFMNAGLYKDAADTLETLPEKDREDLEVLALLGRAAEARGDHGEAQRYAELMLGIDPGCSQALNLFGLISYSKDDHDQARKYFERAVDRDPGYGEPYRSLGLMKWSGGEREEALALLERAFVLSPEQKDSVTSYHGAATGLEAYERAETAFLEARDLRPDNRDIAFLLIDILLKQKKMQTAMDEIEECFIRFGMEEGLLNAALEVRDAIGPMEIDPAGGKPGTLSVCMIVRNEEAGMARCLASLKPVADEIIVVDTGSTDRTKDIARAFGAKVYDFTWTNDFSEARNVSLSHAKGNWILVHDADEVLSPLDHDRLRALIDQVPSKPVAYTIVTRNYTANSALDGWTENHGEYPDEESGIGWCPTPKVRLLVNDERFRFENPVHEMLEPSLWRAKADIRSCDIPIHHYGKLDETRMKEKAEAYYSLGRKKLEDTNNSDRDALRELAIQAAELFRYEEAIDLWKRFIDLNPDNHKAYFNLSTCYFESGRFEEALSAAKRSLEIDSTSKEAVLGYASVSLCAGDVQESIFLLENLLKKVSDYPPAKVALAAAYYIRGMAPRGAALLKELNKKNFNCSVALHSLSQKLIAAGRIEHAAAVIEMMLESGHSHPDSAALLKECRAKMEMKAAASLK